MKKNFKYLSTYTLTAAAAVTLLLTSCGKDPQSPGVEYMPDMYRSPAVEAYVDYDKEYDEENSLRNETLSARKPVKGTIPYMEDQSMAWINFPYPYQNTPEGYDSAALNIKTPFPATPETMAEGKVIFTKFCMHCHGEKGDGKGKIVMNGNFPPIPAYDGIAGLTEGKMFHTITYGKGNMGSHASQINKAEIWKVIHYIQNEFLKK